MGGGRIRMAACAGIVALGVAGCGVEEHENEPRPQAPTRISISINEDTVTVQPGRVAIGPEPTQQIPQNQDVPQPPVRSNEPLTVVLVAANLTDTNSRLRLRGPRDIESGALVANGNGSLLTDLPTGIYKVSAARIPAKAGRLVVGPYRTSSENDVLLP